MPEPIPPPCPASPLPTRTWRQTHGGNRRHAPLPPEYALPEAAPASCGRRNTLSGRAVAPERLRRFSGSSLFPLRRRGYAHLRQSFPPSGTRGRGNLPLLRRVRPSAHIFVIFPPCPFLPAMIQLSAVLRDKARVLLQFPFRSGIPASPLRPPSDGRSCRTAPHVSANQRECPIFSLCVLRPRPGWGGFKPETPRESPGRKERQSLMLRNMPERAFRAAFRQRRCCLR